MRRVVLESPFGKDPIRFIAYGRACLAHSLSLGEAPMAMHLLYTQPGVLNDKIPDERRRGMEAAFLWYECADACVVYRNFGISSGMDQGIAVATRLGLPIEYRFLEQDDLMRKWDIHEPFPDGRLRTATQMIDHSVMFDGNGRLR